MKLWCGSLFFLSFFFFLIHLPVLCSATKQRLLRRKKNQNITAFLQVRRRFFNSLILKVLWGLNYEVTVTLGLIAKIYVWRFNLKAYLVGKKI